MPRTRFQSFIFTLLMVFCMVYVMTCYVIVRNMGGLSYSVFWIALREMWVEYLIVFVLIFFVITKAAQKLTFRIFKPGDTNPIFIILSILEQAKSYEPLMQTSHGLISSRNSSEDHLPMCDYDDDHLLVFDLIYAGKYGI